MYQYIPNFYCISEELSVKNNNYIYKYQFGLQTTDIKGEDISRTFIYIAGKYRILFEKK